MITQSERACIADFGLLTTISDPSQFTPSNSLTGTGTTRWMSPELLHPELFGFSKGSKPTKASDCYALGMVILEVLSGQVPFAGDRDVVVSRKVIDGGRPERPEGMWFTDVLWATLEGCWSPQPENRPTAEAVLECLEPLSIAWQPANGDIERDFNDSRSTIGSHCTFLRFVSVFALKCSCSGLNNSWGTDRSPILL